MENREKKKVNLKEKLDCDERVWRKIGFNSRMLAVRFNWIDREMQKGKTYEQAKSESFNCIDATYELDEFNDR